MPPKHRYVADRSCDGGIETLEPIPSTAPRKELTILFTPFREQKLEIPRSHVPKIPYHWIGGGSGGKWKASRLLHEQPGGDTYSGSSCNKQRMGKEC